MPRLSTLPPTRHCSATANIPAPARPPDHPTTRPSLGLFLTRRGRGNQQLQPTNPSLSASRRTSLLCPLPDSHPLPPTLAGSPVRRAPCAVHLLLGRLARPRTIAKSPGPEASRDGSPSKQTVVVSVVIAASASASASTDTSPRPDSPRLASPRLVFPSASVSSPAPAPPPPPHHPAFYISTATQARATRPSRASLAEA